MPARKDKRPEPEPEKEPEQAEQVEQVEQVEPAPKPQPEYVAPAFAGTIPAAEVAKLGSSAVMPTEVLVAASGTPRGAPVPNGTAAAPRKGKRKVPAQAQVQVQGQYVAPVVARPGGVRSSARRRLLSPAPHVFTTGRRLGPDPSSMFWPRLGPFQVPRSMGRDPGTLEIIRVIRDFDPDAAQSIWTYLRLANPGHTIQHLDESGAVRNDEAVLDYINGLAMRIWAEGGGGADTLINALHLEALTGGGVGIEIEPTESLDDIVDVYPFGSDAIEFRLVREEENGPRRLRMYPANSRMIDAGKETTPLSDLQYLYLPLDPEIGDPYGRPPLLPAVATLIGLNSLINEIRTVLHIHGYGQRDVTVNIQSVMGMAPLEIQQPGMEYQLADFLERSLTQIQSTLNDLDPSDTFVHFDNSTVSSAPAGSVGVPLDAVLDEARRRATTALKSMPIFLGGAESTGVQSTVQWQVFVKGIKALLRLSKRLLEQVYNTALRLRGYTGRIQVTFNDIRETDEAVEQAALAAKIANYREMYELGVIDHAELAMKTASHAPKGPPPPTLAKQAEQASMFGTVTGGAGVPGQDTPLGIDFNFGNEPLALPGQPAPGSDAGITAEEGTAFDIIGQLKAPRPKKGVRTGINLPGIDPALAREIAAWIEENLEQFAQYEDKHVMVAEEAMELFQLPNRPGLFKALWNLAGVLDGYGPVPPGWTDDDLRELARKNHDANEGNPAPRTIGQLKAPVRGRRSKRVVLPGAAEAHREEIAAWIAERYEEYDRRYLDMHVVMATEIIQEFGLPNTPNMLRALWEFAREEIGLLPSISGKMSDEDLDKLAKKKKPNPYADRPPWWERSVPSTLMAWRKAPRRGTRQPKPKRKKPTYRSLGKEELQEARYAIKEIASRFRRPDGSYDLIALAEEVYDNWLMEMPLSSEDREWSVDQIIMEAQAVLRLEPGTEHRPFRAARGAYDALPPVLQDYIDAHIDDWVWPDPAWHYQGAWKAWAEVLPDHPELGGGKVRLNDLWAAVRERAKERMLWPWDGSASGNEALGMGHYDKAGTVDPYEADAFMKKWGESRAAVPPAGVPQAALDYIDANLDDWFSSREGWHFGLAAAAAEHAGMGAAGQWNINELWRYIQLLAIERLGGVYRYTAPRGGARVYPIEDSTREHISEVMGRPIQGVMRERLADIQDWIDAHIDDYASPNFGWHAAMATDLNNAFGRPAWLDTAYVWALIREAAEAHYGTHFPQRSAKSYAPLKRRSAPAPDRWWPEWLEPHRQALADYIEANMDEYAQRGVTWHFQLAADAVRDLGIVAPSGDTVEGYVYSYVEQISEAHYGGRYPYGKKFEWERSATPGTRAAEPPEVAARHEEIVGWMEERWDDYDRRYQHPHVILAADAQRELGLPDTPSVLRALWVIARDDVAFEQADPGVTAWDLEYLAGDRGEFVVDENGEAYFRTPQAQAREPFKGRKKHALRPISRELSSEDEAALQVAMDAYLDQYALTGESDWVNNFGDRFARERGWRRQEYDEKWFALTRLLYAEAIARYGTDTPGRTATPQVRGAVYKSTPEKEAAVAEWIETHIDDYASGYPRWHADMAIDCAKALDIPQSDYSAVYLEVQLAALAHYGGLYI